MKILLYLQIFLQEDSNTENYEEFSNLFNFIYSGIESKDSRVFRYEIENFSNIVKEDKILKSDMHVLKSGNSFTKW